MKTNINIHNPHHKEDRLLTITIKLPILAIITLTSFLALSVQFTNTTWDPIKSIQELKTQHRRDEALDLLQFAKENHLCPTEELKPIEKDLSYGFTEKLKATVIDGIIKGEVYDTSSGIGAMAADLCLFGDIRDITIQTWNAIFHRDDFNGVTATLSGIGIAFSAMPMFGILSAAEKSTVKYVAKIPDINKGMLKRFLTGKVSKRESAEIYNLLKKTDGVSQEQLHA